MPFLVFMGALVLLSLSGGFETGLANSDFSQQSNTANFATSSEAQNVGFTIRTSNTADRNKSGTTRNADVTPVVREQTFDLRPPEVETIYAQNIEDNSATLRGYIDMRAYTDGVVFVAYGYNERDINAVGGRYNSYAEIPQLTNDRARVQVLDRRANGIEEYSRQISRLVKDTEYYFRICTEYSTLFNAQTIVCGNTESFTTNPSDPRSNRFSLPSVSLGRVTAITAGDAVLNGNVRMNDAVDGIAFFVYGESRELINEVATLDTFTDVRESDEDLQRVRVAANLRGRAEYNYQLDDLDTDTRYYYRLCVEYDGDESGLRCTRIGNFTTDSRNRNNLPSVQTGTAVVSANAVRVSGRISMNDFLDGIAFIAIGSDEQKVAVAPQADSFQRLRQSGDSFQKILLDADVDGSQSYTETINNLNAGTKYFYRVCVDYENEDDRNRTTTFLQCGEVKNVVAR